MFPCFVLAPYILAVWLGQIPDYALNFVRLILLQIVIDCLSPPLMTLVSASGKIAFYQVVVGGMQVLFFPVVWFCFKCGMRPEAAFFCSITCSCICLFLRLLIVSRITGLPKLMFLRKVVVPAILCVAIVIVITRLLLPGGGECAGFAEFLIKGAVTFCVTVAAIFTVCLQPAEREALLKMLKNKLLTRRIGNA